MQLNVSGESLERRDAKNFPLEVWQIGKKMLLFPFTLGKAPIRAFIQENVFFYEHAPVPKTALGSTTSLWFCKISRASC